MQNSSVVILAARRTPIGAFLGAFNSVSATELGSVAIGAALKDSGVSANEVQEVIMLWTAGLVHDPDHSADAILADIDETIRKIQEQPVAPAEFERALTKMRSGFYDVIGSAARFGLVDLLASFALFDDDPARINKLDVEFRKVTPELIQQTARKYLVASNRTVLTIEPAKADGKQGGGT